MRDILLVLGSLLPLGIVLFCISMIVFPCHFSEDPKGDIITGISIMMIIIGLIAIIIGWFQ
jgi:hypothetical protein